MHGPFETILDVGSLDENGSVKDAINHSKNRPFRTLLGGGNRYEYAGVDMREGKNVDVVLNAHDLLDRFDPDSIDFVTCCEMIEHDDRFWLSIECMRKIVKPGGWLLVTAPGIHFFRHDYPDDFYRFTDSAFKKYIFEGYEDVVVGSFQEFNKYPGYEPLGPDSIMGYGRKPMKPEAWIVGQGIAEALPE